jgi:hypothetical protein
LPVPVRTPALTPTLAALAVALASASLTGCGYAARALGIGGEAAPTCRADAEPADLPTDGFAARWPFPARTTVYGRTTEDGTTVLTAVSGAGFERVLATMDNAVVDAGFRVHRSRTGRRSAWATWQGNGWHGRWSIRPATGCPGETAVRVEARPG